MSSSISLFRLRGIEVKVHLSFVLILVWAAYIWGFGAGAGLNGALFGVFATVLLFACITLHELAHSLEALREGVRVREILLLPIGGVSRMDEVPRDPGQELRITVVGPLVSLLLGAIFLALTLALGGTLDLVSTALATPTLSATALIAYLALANLVLGAFNLIPAFPMDGGRVLRALLALWLPYRQATAIAATIGQTFAWILALVGFVSGNLVLLLVALFIWMGAAAEGHGVDSRSSLHDLIVEDAMSRDPHTVTRTDPLARAVDYTLTSLQADFPVLNPGTGQVVGLLTRDDLLRGLRAMGPKGVVGEVMHEDCLIVRPTDSLADIQRRLSASAGRLAVVVDDGTRVRGLLTATDVAEVILIRSASDQRDEDRAERHRSRALESAR